MSEQQTKEEEREERRERLRENDDMTYTHTTTTIQNRRIRELIVCMDDVYMCIYETRSATEYDDYDAVFFFCM